MKTTLATPESKERFHHYADVVDSPEINWRGTITGPFSKGTALDNVQGILVSDEWYAPTRLAIAECKLRGVAVFHVIDGILEWRNLFENPRSGDPNSGSPLFQPLMADHTFCMGPFQKWQLEWLGNSSIHSTGLPRLDKLAVHPCASRQSSDLPRLLIATANTPWFTPEQHRRFTVEFARLVELCQQEVSRATPAFQVFWRIAPIAAAALDLVPDTAFSASEALANCAALITTPSTFAIEAMLMGVPTLLFDPFACPGFIPAAWHATSAETAFAQIPSLLRPDPPRCRLQDSLRAVVAPTDSGASRRVRESILQAVNAGSSPPSALPIGFPPSPVAPLNAFVSAKFAGQFSPADVHALQATLPSLEATIHSQKARIEQLQQQLYTPNLADGARSMARAVRNSLGRR